jgi:hypothetical protein
MVMDRYKEPHYYDTSLVIRIEGEVLFHSGYELKSRGYVCNIELGGSDIIPGRIGGATLPAFSLDIISSYLFSPYVSLGLGLGTELSGSGYNIEMLSVYADTRVYFMKSNIGPFLDVAVGYNAMFMKYTDYDTFSLRPPSIREMDNGLMFNSSLGIRVTIGTKVAMTASMGYKLYYLLSPENYYYIISDNSTFKPDAHGYYLFNALTIKAGFQF